jgi:NADH-quinone oxidoreductase subunit E
VNGAERVTEEICHALHIKPGETDASGTFTLIEVECLGACDRAPVIMVNDAWQELQRPEDVPTLLNTLRTQGEAGLTGCCHVVEKP